MTTAAEWRYHDERNARSVAEEIQGLDIAGIVETAALVHGYESGRLGEQRLVGIEVIDDFHDHALEEIKLRRRRMAIEQTIGLDE